MSFLSTLYSFLMRPNGSVRASCPRSLALSRSTRLTCRPIRCKVSSPTIWHCSACRSSGGLLSFGCSCSLPLQAARHGFRDCCRRSHPRCSPQLLLSQPLSCGSRKSSRRSAWAAWRLMCRTRQESRVTLRMSLAPALRESHKKFISTEARAPDEPTHHHIMAKARLWLMVPRIPTRPDR
jgi:hypothetical protein